MHHSISFRCALGLLAFGALAVAANAQVSLKTTGTNVYTQSFDSLAASGNRTWTDNTTLVGWFASGFPGNNYSTASSSTNNLTRDLYSFGSSAADRALGSYNGGNGAAPIYYGVRLTNDTGATITSFTATVRAENYSTDGNGDVTAAAFGLGNTSLTTGTWTNATALNLQNAVAGQTLSFTPTGTINWTTGQSLWLRWADSNLSGTTDAALAIDNFAFTAIPEPSTYALALGAGGIGLAALRRWRARRVV